MDEIIKKTARVLRELGFRGSGQTYRKAEDDFVFVINFQRSRWGDVFFVNLGAQPTFIPAEGGASLKTLKEYECLWRNRVGKEWAMELSDEQLESFIDTLVAAQSSFFGHAKTFRMALTTCSPDELLDKYSSGQTRAYASLQLARAALVLQHPDVARVLAARGLDLANEGATVLVAELQKLLDQT